jgi:cephalosporin hydroxylase
MNEINKFNQEKQLLIECQGKDIELKNKSLGFIYDTLKYKYSYHFTWLGRPIIQYPQDIVATQEIIWEVKPDLIIETGIAHGGSLMNCENSLRSCRRDES